MYCAIEIIVQIKILNSESVFVWRIHFHKKMLRSIMSGNK